MWTLVKASSYTKKTKHNGFLSGGMQWKSTWINIVFPR